MTGTAGWHSGGVRPARPSAAVAGHAAGFNAISGPTLTRIASCKLKVFGGIPLVRERREQPNSPILSTAEANNEEALSLIFVGWKLAETHEQQGSYAPCSKPAAGQVKAVRAAALWLYVM